MFEKSLTDLVRGLRANKKAEDRFVAAAITESRSELRRNDLDAKTNAVSKLCLLHMMGYDMSWASFHIIEVMSSPKLAQKRIGYMAAALSFRQDTDVLMLSTNLIKKDLSSNSFEDGAVAMHALAQIVTPDLGRDLHADLIAMLTHSRPYMRKRAVIALYRIFLKYPDALRAAFPRLKERLDDPDPTVVCAVVNVVCELARKNPKSYLPLAPQLHGLLTTSSNNWMLIKIIKLFASLTPLEPRLTRNLVPPIVNIIQTTSAMSLTYECVHTLIVGGMIAPESSEHSPGGVASSSSQTETPQGIQIAALCANKLKLLIEDSDQNLKYLGLYALGKLIAIRPSAVNGLRDIILKCLSNPDYSIRLCTLDLITSMANEHNLFGIVKHLLLHLIPKSRKRATALLSTQESQYRTQVGRRIITMCSKDTYASITNFEWYISVLIDLAYCPGIQLGMAIATQWIQVCVRVRDVVPFAVASLARLIADDGFFVIAAKDDSLSPTAKLGGVAGKATATAVNNADVFYGAAWVVGEYCEYLADPKSTMMAMLAPQLDNLSPVIQAVYLHNLLKVFTFWVCGKPGLNAVTSVHSHASVDASGHHDTRTVIKPHTPPLKDEVSDVVRRMITRLTLFTTSADLEVQDRASTVLEILKLVLIESETDDTIVTEPHASASRHGIAPLITILPSVFAGEFNPVAAKAQRKVPVPDGLDLKTWIYEPVSESPTLLSPPSSLLTLGGPLVIGNDTGGNQEKRHNHNTESTRRDRLQRIRNDPFYLPGNTSESIKSTSIQSDQHVDGSGDPVDAVPIKPFPLGRDEVAAIVASSGNTSSATASTQSRGVLSASGGDMTHTGQYMPLFAKSIGYQQQQHVSPVSVSSALTGVGGVDVHGVANLSRLSSQRRYQLKTEEDVPPGVVSLSTDTGRRHRIGTNHDDDDDELDEAQMLEHLRINDPDRYAVMSVDLTSGHDTGVDVVSGIGAVAFASSSGSSSVGGSGSNVYEALPDVNVGVGVDTGKLKKKKKKKEKETMDGDVVKKPKKVKKSKKKSDDVDTQQSVGDAITTPPVMARDTNLSLWTPIPSDELVAHEDDYVSVVYRWEHACAPDALDADGKSLLDLSIHMRVSVRFSTTRHAEGHAVVMDTVDLVSTDKDDTAGSLGHGCRHCTVGRVSPTEYIVRGVVHRPDVSTPFLTQEWRMSIRYMVETGTIPQPSDSVVSTLVHRQEHCEVFGLRVPSMVNLYHPQHSTVMQMTPTVFLSLLTQNQQTGLDTTVATTTSSVLGYASTVQWIVPSTIGFDVCVQRMAMRLNLRILETHTIPARAASVYGLSILGCHVAGLIKERVVAGAMTTSPATTGNVTGNDVSETSASTSAASRSKKRAGVAILIDLRCGHPGLLDLIVDEVHVIGSEIVEGSFS